jgi:hypothetical protein
LAAAIALFVISLGAILAGQGYVKTARRMRTFRTTRGRVTGRELAAVAGGTREGRWGKGGGYRPKVTYVFTVNGVELRLQFRDDAPAGQRANSGVQVRFPAPRPPVP